LQIAESIIKTRNYGKKALMLAVLISLILCASRLSAEYSQPRQAEQSVSSQTVTEGPPDIRSAYFNIYVSPGVDLNRVYKRINRRYFPISYGRKPDSLASSEEKIAYRMDALMERVEQILDIYPQGVRINIRIFKTRKELNDFYGSLFKTNESYNSFYINKLKTIYISEQDISDSILAHEIGHVVVDHYFKVVPSETVREMLATYVDLHLDD